MADQARLLVVDDEVYLADLMATALRYEGFEARKAGSGREALAAIAEFRPQLVILDVLLPDLDGFEVARRLGAEGQRLPILFLTARDATEDKVRGLTIGGDDYVTKPFSIAELVARVRAVLRRVAGQEEPRRVLSFADLEMDEDRHEVRRAGTIVDLTTTEYRLRRFIADASHELRTPLSSIRGYAELFRCGAAAHPEDLALTMRRIEDEGARMGRLVDDLLLLARLDEGRPLERGPVDLATLAVDAAADARAAATGRPIALDADDDVVVAGDEARLRQVVGNLVRNALVHTPAGTPVAIAASRKGDAGVFRVADHGPGVPAEAAARIFERFYRADPGGGRDHGGSGLGLSIVAAVVAAHGGTVDLRGTPGGGATFTVHLPLYACEEQPQGEAS